MNNPIYYEPSEHHTEHFSYTIDTQGHAALYFTNMDLYQLIDKIPENERLQIRFLRFLPGSAVHSSTFRWNIHTFPNLQELDLSELNLGNLTDISYAFQGMTRLQRIYMPHDLSSIQYMQHLFTGCSQLKEIRFPSSPQHQPHQLISTEAMFSHCHQLETLDISGFSYNTLIKNHLNHMFSDCPRLSNLKCFHGPVWCPSLSNLFKNCISLQSLDLSRISIWSGTLITDSMFANCTALKSVQLPQQTNPVKLTDTAHMFENCRNLKQIDLHAYQMPVCKSTSCMFDHCTQLHTLIPPAQPVNMPDEQISAFAMFRSCTQLKSIDLSRFFAHTSINCKEAFSGCSQLETLNIPAITDVCNIEDMLLHCDHLKHCPFFEGININEKLETHLPAKPFFQLYSNPFLQKQKKIPKLHFHKFSKSPEYAELIIQLCSHHLLSKSQIQHILDLTAQNKLHYSAEDQARFLQAAYQQLNITT